MNNSPQSGKYRTTLIVITLALASVAGYLGRRSYLMDKANSAFDPEGRALSGFYLPWPLGNPTIVGQLDLQSAIRIMKDEKNPSGKTEKDNMKLVIHASDATFKLDFK